MKNIINILISVLAVACITGCEAIKPTGMSARQKAKEDLKKTIADVEYDSNLFKQNQKILSDFWGNPDTDAWQEQRKKIAQSIGDRIFDTDFNRVYDSLVLAVSTLELKVNNMERTSGFIQATGIALPPSESKAVSRETIIEWLRLNGYDSSVLDKNDYRSNKIWDIQQQSIQVNTAYYLNKPRSLTFQLVKMGDKQTKVKLRFADVFYPPEIESYYKIVWKAVDKQIFVDQNIEGTVESRAEPITLASPISEKEKSSVVPVPTPTLTP